MFEFIGMLVVGYIVWCIFMLTVTHIKVSNVLKEEDEKAREVRSHHQMKAEVERQMGRFGSRLPNMEGDKDERT